MSIVFIIVYCLLAAMFIFGLTFHDELRKERERQRKTALIVLPGGKDRRPKLRRRV